MNGYSLNDLTFAMMEHDKGHPKLIQHFLKVHAFARLIGEGEKLDEKLLFTLETACIVHDIGILPAKAKHGSGSGKFQEMEGPTEAKEMLEHLGWPADVTKRVLYLVGHHHTYTDIDGADYQIMVEADFLVNLLENQSEPEAQKTAYQKIFRTETGKKIFALQFPEAL